MDADGNLTDVSEFSGGRRIRLISMLDEDVAIGVFPGSDGWNALGVHRISSGNPEQSIFVATAVGDIGLFNLAWDVQPSDYMSWEGDGSGRLQVIPIGPDAGDPVQAPLFTVTFVDGCWFCLENYAKSIVVDCSHSCTDENNPIIAHDWKDSDNEKWRAATVGPGLDAAAKDAGSATDTRLPPNEADSCSG
jgi:hypothetical protein